MKVEQNGETYKAKTKDVHEMLGQIWTPRSPEEYSEGKEDVTRLARMPNCSLGAHR